MPNELVTVRTFGSPIEAEIARNQLVEAGIPAMVTGADGASSLFAGFGPAFGAIKIQVAEADRDRALEILGQEEEELDDDWEATTDFQTGETAHGLTGSYNPATEPDRAITAGVSPGDSEQRIQSAPPAPRELPAAGTAAADSRDVAIGPNDLAARALKVGAIGVLVTPGALFFMPFFFWFLVFLAFQLYSTFLLAKLAGISEELEPPVLRKMYGAVVFNMFGWVEVVVMLILIGRVLLLLRLL